MSADGAQFRGRIVSAEKVLRRGLYGVVEGIQQANFPYDGSNFDLTTGGNGLADASPTAPGTYVLLPASFNPNGTMNMVGVPPGCAVDVRSFSFSLLPGAGWSGGTAGNVSISLQGTDGTLITTVTQSALSVGSGAAGSGTITAGSVSSGGAAPAFGTDYGVRSIGASLPVGVGLVLVIGNSTAGAPCRVSVQGRFVTSAFGA